MSEKKTCACGGLERHRLLEDFLKEIRLGVAAYAQTMPAGLLGILAKGIARIDDFEARKRAERKEQEKNADRMVAAFGDFEENSEEEIWPWGWRI